VEEAAVASGLVAEAVALGVADDRLGQAIALVARPAEGREVSETALRTWFKRELPTFMHPAHILWRSELPRGPNGKLDRERLKAELSA
jgi:acyl-CoA synthetase (AMP-forming)/AMP-acid ligase II